MTERHYGLSFPLLVNVCGVAFLWLVIILRAIPAMRQRSQRTMWSALFLGALAMALQASLLYDFAVRLIGQDPLGTARDIVGDIVGLFAAAAIFSFVLSVVGKDRYSKLTYCVALLVTMVLLSIDWHFDARTSDGLSQRSFTGNLYWLILLLYHCIANAWCAFICWQCFRRTSSPPLRAALLCFSAGTATAALFMLLSIAHILTNAKSIAYFFPLMAGIEAFLYGAGAATPTAWHISRSLFAAKRLLKLYPLWRDITQSIQEVSLYKSRNYFSYMFASGLDRNLYRRVIEIQDGLLILHSYVPPQEYHAATRFARERVLPDNVEPATTACWLAVGLRNKKDGHGKPDRNAEQAHQEVKLVDEIAYLDKVAFFHRSPIPEAFTHSLYQNPTAEIAEVSR